MLSPGVNILLSDLDISFEWCLELNNSYSPADTLLCPIPVEKRPRMSASIIYTPISKVNLRLNKDSAYIPVVL